MTFSVETSRNRRRSSRAIEGSSRNVAVHTRFRMSRECVIPGRLKGQSGFRESRLSPPSSASLAEAPTYLDEAAPFYPILQTNYEFNKILPPPRVGQSKGSLFLRVGRKNGHVRGEFRCDPATKAERRINGNIQLRLFHQQFQSIVLPAES